VLRPTGEAGPASALKGTFYVYAVIRTGGKQERVAQGQRLRVELLGRPEGEEVSFTPVLLVDGERVVSAAGDLSGVTVSARVVGEEKGPKIRGFKYKNKSRSRKRWGHRQHYSTIEITGISEKAGK
jgi:large subunit ribosomal protein L21